MKDSSALQIACGHNFLTYVVSYLTVLLYNEQQTANKKGRRVDYQTWLKAFDAELSQHWEGIVVNDLDPLHLQSLFHKALSPLDAARQRPVLKEVSDLPPIPKKLSLQWLFITAAIVLVLGFGVIWRVRHVPLVALGNAHSAASSPGQTEPVHGYPDETVNYSSFASYQSFFPHSIPYRESSPKASFPRRTQDAANYGLARGSVNPSTSGGPSGSDDSGRETPFSYDQSVKAQSAGTGTSSDQQTPVIQQFQVTSLDQSDQGFSGQISWQVSNADQVQVLVLDSPLTSTSTLQGSIPFSGLALGATVTLRASKNGKTVEQTANVAGVQG